MGKPVIPVEAQRIACEVCLKEVPRSEAAVAEAVDYVAYFCGLECFEKWKSKRDESSNAGAAPDAGSQR